MNKRGNPKSLVASQPGNLNAAKQGVHSPRLIQTRAAEIANELTQAFEFSPAERLAVHEAARCIAILEAIDRDLDQRGLVDKEGKPRYLLNHRSRTSRQLEHWLEKVSAAIEREAASEQAPPQGEFADYVRALQRIALGQDATATARDRLGAVKELLERGEKATTSYLERPAQPEFTEREHAIREAYEKRSLERRERELGIARLGCSVSSEPPSYVRIAGRNQTALSPPRIAARPPSAAPIWSRAPAPRADLESRALFPTRAATAPARARRCQTLP